MRKLFSLALGVAVSTQTLLPLSAVALPRATGGGFLAQNAPTGQPVIGAANPGAAPAEAPAEFPNDRFFELTIPDVAPLKNVKPGVVPGTPDYGRPLATPFVDPQLPAVGDGAVPSQPRVDYGLYHKWMGELDDYKHQVSDAVESALQLYLPLPVKRVQQLMYQSDVRKANFEAAYLSGDIDRGRIEYDEARRLLTEALVLSTPSSRVEGRAIWLDRGSIVASSSPQGLKNLIKQIHQAGINIVYFETINAGYPAYNSKYLSKNPLIGEWDPLQVAVEEGHRLGMEVHAWVWCFAVGNIKHNYVVGKPDSYPGQVLEEKGFMSEALRSSSGGLIPPKGSQSEYWLSPASPRARAFLKDVYTEIVTNYDVDGIQLDYIRYPFQNSRAQMGFEAVGRQRFQDETGLMLNVLDDYTLKSWAAWKSFQVSSFVKDISETMRKLKPGIKISAAVYPMRRAERILAVQQDWETWINKGWIDTLSPMTYTSSKQEFLAHLDYLSNASENKSTLIYPGVALFRLDSAELLDRLEAVRGKGVLGSTLFAMAHLDQAKTAALGQGPYKEHKVVSPHKDPVKALSLLTEDFQAKFNQLASKGELDRLGQSNVQSLQRSLSTLAGLCATLGTQQSAGGKLSPQTLASARSELNSLEDKTRRWLEIEKTTHPYRAQFFTEFPPRMTQLLEYMTSRANLPANPTL